MSIQFDAHESMRATYMAIATGLLVALIFSWFLLFPALSGMAYGQELSDPRYPGLAPSGKMDATHRMERPRVDRGSASRGRSFHRGHSVADHARDAMPGRLDANGNRATVRARSGVTVRVAPAARAALQCVIDAVEAAGVRIKALRGYGRGTVRGSLHPGGLALDINQTARNVTHPPVPRSVSNAAADHCGVISGARWGYADNGHWNLPVHGRPREPWPRTLMAKGRAL